MPTIPPLEVPELASGNPQLQRAMGKIVNLEQRNLGKVEEKIAKQDNKLKLVSDFKTKFTELRDAAKPFKSVNDFRDLKGDSSDPAILKVGAIDKEKAVPGSYTLEVIELASPSSLMTRGVPDRDQTELGVGYISFKTPEGEEKDVYINSDNNTLDGIAKAINRANLGVKASVINDGTDADNPFRLILAGEKTGWRNDMDWAEFNFLDGDLDLDQDYRKEATSAAIKFNGQPMYVDENKLKELIPGVTVDLLSAKPGQTVNLEVKPDVEKVEGKAKNLVDKMNAVLTAIHTQFQLGPDSKNDPTKALAGDVSLQSLQNQMRSLIQDSAANLDGGQIKQLRDVGIVFNRGGTLDYDPKKFQAALDSRFEEVANLFSGSDAINGFANGLVRVADNATRTGDGILSLREKGLGDVKRRLQTEVEQKRERAEKRIERAKSQFGRAEAAMEQMKGMGAAAAGIGAGSAGG